jgi:hypothetical protein
MGARTGVIAEYNGGRTAGWFDAVTAGGGADAAASSETVTGVTVAEINELLVAPVILEATGALTSVTAGWTNETGVASGTTVRTLDWASKIRTDGAGTEPDLTIGHASTTSNHFMLAFREQPAAPPPSTPSGGWLHVGRRRSAIRFLGGTAVAGGTEALTIPFTLPATLRA